MIQQIQQLAVATLNNISLALPELLQNLHQSGRLQPLLQEALVTRFLTERAAQAGIEPTTEELQHAADAFRRRQGLTSAQQTYDWLARQRRSVEDLEASLERDLLITKLKEHLTRQLIEPHFAAHKENYAQVEFRQIVVPREDFAKELLTQIHDEGSDFIELARRYSRDVARDETLGAMRKDLPDSDAEVIFAAKAGDIVGPLATSAGFCLYRIEEIWEGELDSHTRSIIRDELFNDWLQNELADAEFTYPVLETL